MGDESADRSPGATDVSGIATRWDAAIAELFDWFGHPDAQDAQRGRRSTAAARRQRIDSDDANATQSSKGAATAKALCRSFRTGSPATDAHDLISETRLRVLRRRAHAVADGVEPPDNIEAYATEIMKNVLKRAYGAPSPAAPGRSDFDGDAYPHAVLDNGDVDAARARDRVGRLRSGIESVECNPAERSAALAYVTLFPALTGGDAERIDIADLPWPRAGARPDQAAMWPCAYLATQDRSMFPNDVGGGAAQRKRLSRFCQRATDVVLLAATRTAP